MGEDYYEIKGRSHAIVNEGDLVSVRGFKGEVTKKTCNGRVYSYRVELEDGGVCTVIDDRPWWEAGGK